MRLPLSTPLGRISDPPVFPMRVYLTGMRGCTFETHDKQRSRIVGVSHGARSRMARSREERAASWRERRCGPAPSQTRRKTSASTLFLVSKGAFDDVKSVPNAVIKRTLGNKGKCVAADGFLLVCEGAGPHRLSLQEAALSSRERASQLRAPWLAPTIQVIVVYHASQRCTLASQ